MEDEIKIGKFTIFLEKKLKNHGLIKDYIALDDQNEKYICKIVPVEKSKVNKKFEELKKKIEIHKNIEHDNIFTLIDFDIKHNNIFIFYEYLEGKTLEVILKNKENYLFDEMEIFIIIEQITNILIFFYDNKIVIKDLSLKNIFIKNKTKPNETTHVLLCNLEKDFLLSKNMNQFEEYYKLIVFRLGLIICKLINRDFYFYLINNNLNEDKEENSELINDYMQKNIINNSDISKSTKNFIIQTCYLKMENNIHITKFKEEDWFRQFYKKIKKMKKNNHNIEEKTNESSTNENISTTSNSIKANLNNNVNSIKENINNTANSIKGSINNNIKSNIEEETIITDEGYLELYEKEKELRLGLIDNFDKDELIKSINNSKKYLKYYINYTNSEEIDNEKTQRSKDENQKSTCEEENFKKRTTKTRESKSLFCH